MPLIVMSSRQQSAMLRPRRLPSRIVTPPMQRSEKAAPSNLTLWKTARERFTSSNEESARHTFPTASFTVVSRSSIALFPLHVILAVPLTPARDGGPETVSFPFRPDDLLPAGFE